MLKSVVKPCHCIPIRFSTSIAISLVIGGCVIMVLFFLNLASSGSSFHPLSILYKTDVPLKAAFVNSFGRLQSVLSPQLQWCESNPFLRHYNQNAVLDLELKWFDWTRNKLPTTYRVLKEYAVSKGNTKRDIVHLAYPNSLALPCPYHGSLKRYGGSSDGSKVLCGVESLASLSKCIIYSLGSGGQFNFEFDLLNRTSCKIHTYDCTQPVPKRLTKGLTFHQICMGGESSLQRFIFPNAGKKSDDLLSDFSLFRSFHEIVEDNGHTDVHVLKMDIEGGEYSVFADLLNYPSKQNLPYQISFESHWWDTDIYHATLHQQMFTQLWTYGYRYLHHELNEGDNSCVEWTLMRVFC